jgi:hypothetical protein
MALTLDGSTQWLTLGSALRTAIPFTIAGWVYQDSGHGQHTAVNISDGSANNRFTVQLDSSGTLEAETAESGSDSKASATSDLSADTWGHIAAVFASATDRRALLDGANKGTNTTSRTPSGLNASALGTSLSGGGTQDWLGRFAHMGLWSVALSDVEIAMLALGYLPPQVKPASLLSYWILPGGVATELDRWDGGNNWTTAGSPTASAGPPKLIQGVGPL